MLWTGPSEGDTCDLDSFCLAPSQLPLFLPWLHFILLHGEGLGCLLHIFL
jgi:hypothetical protein